jgi:hypothetical protein
MAGQAYTAGPARLSAWQEIFGAGGWRISSAEPSP